MLSVHAKIPKKKRIGGALQPVLPLIPEKIEVTEELKSKLITFELNTKERQGEGEIKYKKSVRKFDEGSVELWIELLRRSTRNLEAKQDSCRPRSSCYCSRLGPR